MITMETQLKVQAFLDGELAGAEARDIAALVANDHEVAALVAELKYTGEVFRRSEEGMKLPETREFYWSKVCRGIERAVTNDVPQPMAPSAWHWMARWLKPFGAIAAVILAGLLVFHTPNNSGKTVGTVTTTAGTDAFTYRDDANATTLVWFTFPSENAVANGNGAATLN